MPYGYYNKTGLPYNHGLQKGHIQINSEKGKKATSERLKKLWKIKEYREKMVKYTKGKVGYMLGYKHTKESLQKMSDCHKGKIPKNVLRGELSGKNHWLWKGGITPENNKIRGSAEYKHWRMSVFVRDNFTCQKYGERGGYLIAHHINNFSGFKELRLATDNGVTLSDKAHKEFHSIYGKKNNTKEQLDEFLSTSQKTENLG